MKVLRLLADLLLIAMGVSMIIASASMIEVGGIDFPAFLFAFAGGGVIVFGATNAIG